MCILNFLKDGKFTQLISKNSNICHLISKFVLLDVSRFFKSQNYVMFTIRIRLVDRVVKCSLNKTKNILIFSTKSKVSKP